MVQISGTMLAAVGYLLTSSSFLFVSGSPVSDSPVVPTDRGAGLPEGYALTPINWRGTLKAGGPLVYLSGDTFEVCVFISLSLSLCVCVCVPPSRIIY
jgi:hypothetical protein